MNIVTEHNIQCPCCWEAITILVDCSVAYQEYIEDCPVCCRPMELRVSVAEGGVVDILADGDGG